MLVTEEKKDANPCDFPNGKLLGDWSIQAKLDEGGFGQVYRVTNVNDPKIVAALKVEPNDLVGGSAIKLETLILKQISSDGEKFHVPTVLHAAKNKKFSYLVMTLLGENLKILKNSCPGERLSTNTWCRIALQCLYGIKLVHDYGFVHRDIKLNNFVMGHPSDDKRARIVSILDFGLARVYATKNANGQWIPRRARCAAEFRGTLRYCSINVHKKQEQGRVDDLWSLLYILVELDCELPWQKEKDRTRVESMKMIISNKHLMQFMPAECGMLPDALSDLNCYMRPNYSYWAKALQNLQHRLAVTYWDPFDWERKDEVDALKKKFDGKLPDWLINCNAFFDSDPIGTFCHPSKKDKFNN